MYPERKEYATVDHHLLLFALAGSLLGVVMHTISNIIRVSLPALFAAVLFSSCASIISGTIINPAVSNLQKQSDIDLVCEGAASYLLMIDSLIESNPENRAILLNGAQAYSGSTAALVSCNAAPTRIAAISAKARLYGKRLLSQFLPIEDGSSGETLDAALGALSAADARYLFWGAFGWLSWVQQQQGSPASMADLVVIEKIMKRLLELDETIENGSPHLFFAALYGAKPAMIGGDPARSRRHFERALEISARSSLIVQTTFAETYCRMVFDQALHDALLHEVLDFTLDQKPSQRLVNQIAKRRARQLLDEKFFE